MSKRFFQNKTAVFTTLIVLVVAFIGILAPVVAPNDPYETNIINKFAGYSMEYPLGTDQLGRCVLSRMIYGIRPTLGLAALTMVGTIGIGAVLGIMAGYFRGIVEEVIMRIVDVMLSFPSQIMVFAVVALLGVSVQNVIIANVFIKWAWYARMIRTGVMQYRDKNFVQFSRCVGNAGTIYPVSSFTAIHNIGSGCAGFFGHWVGNHQYFYAVIFGVGSSGTDTRMGSDAE